MRGRKRRRRKRRRRKSCSLVVVRICFGEILYGNNGEYGFGG